MRKTTLLKGTFLISTLCAFGCANTESGISRRGMDDTIDINGAGYASKEVSEGNVFGKESEGLPENPLTEPSDDLLGPTGVYENLVYTIEPVDSEAFINEVVEFKVKIDTSDGNSKQNREKGRFVVVLERPADGNGVLLVDKTSLYSASEFPPSDTTAVLQPTNNEITFRVLTGSAYGANMTPMYWINVWAADAAEPASAKLVVKQPPKKSDFDKGNSDVSNSLDMPGSFEGEWKDSALSSVDLTTDDDLEQGLLVDSSKTFTVKLENPKCETGTETSDDAKCTVKDETVCWTFVEHKSPNTGAIREPALDDKYQFEEEDKKSIQAGCGKVDDEDEVSVKIYTGGAYDARYYLNFFHAKSAPLTFQIDTYAMPDTLGEPGDGPTDDLDGDGVPDEGRDIEVPEDAITVDPVTGKEQIVGCEAAKFLDKLWTEPTDIDDQIAEQCGVEDLEKPGVCNNADCSANGFKCRLTKEPDGTMMLSTCDGDVVMVDLDGDGIADPVRVVVTDNGDGTYRFDGFDTDGDGKPDVAPDPCLYTTCPTGDDLKYQLLCQVLKDGAEPKEDNYKACTKVSAGLEEDLDVYMKLVDVDDESKGAGSGHELNAKIIRGSLPSNNAMFDGKEGTDTVDLTTDSDSLAETLFWTGTAYDAFYYIKVVNEAAKTVMLPVNVINSVNIPTKPGDKPDEDETQPGGEAYTPPSDLGPYIPDLGPLVLEVAPGLSQDISSPVIRTLGLKVVLKYDADKQGKTGTIPQEKVWWKVTRGKSSANNGTLTANTSETDTTGTALNYFYTGTGYDSLYYVSVFHPNVLDDEGNPQPLIFSITTTNNTGTVPGPEPGDPSLPEGDTECPEGSTLVRKCGDKEVEKDVTKCPDNTNPKQSCINDESGEEEDPTTVNGIDVNPNLPQMTCEDYEKECADGSSESCNKGCLELQIVGNSYKRFQPGKVEKAQFKLIHRNGSDITVVSNENIHYTLDKNPEVNAALLSKKSPTDPDGKATASFTTGSKTTSYKLNAMHPNINDGGNMIPATVNITIYDPSQEPTDTSDSNKIKLNVEDPSNISLYPGDSLDNVYYYVVSSDKAQCGEDFVYNGTEGRKSGCRNLDSANGYCEIEPAAAPYSTEVSVKNGKTNYTVYAVGTNKDGEPVASGCVSYQSFPSWTKPKACTINKNDFATDDEYNAKLEEIKADPSCTRSMTVTVPMSKMPMVIDSVYQTKTLVNIGPLVKEGTEVGDQIKAIVDKVNAFIGANPEETLTQKLTQYFIYTDENGDPSLAGAKDCMTQIIKMTGNCVRQNGEQMPDNISATCNSWNTEHRYTDGGTEKIYTWDAAVKNENKEYFKNCECICAEMYYWTAVDKLGTKIAKLAKKGIKSLIKKYLGRDSLTDHICGVVDDLQYITLTGQLKLNKNGTSYTGGGEYSGIEVPFLGETLDLGAKVIGGTWQQAIVSDAGNQIAISKYALNLTYGELIYQLLGKTIGMDENGNIDLINSLCDKLPSINLLVVELSSEMLGALCKSGVETLQNKAVQFAASKYVNLSVTLDGAATFERGKTEKAKGGGYYAQLITGGQWEGTGTLGADKAEGKTADDSINGLWVGARNADDMPAFKYGTKTVDEFKAENSVCRKLMSEAAAKEAENANMDSNKVCLGGTYDPTSRLTNHQCKKDECKTNKSVVVCDSDGKLNQQYANSNASEIIKAANRACADDSTKDKTGCDKNPEIINGGKGITNEECFKNNCSATAGCTDNPSIFVCADANEKLTDSELCQACECDACHVEADDYSGTGSCTEAELKECYQAKAQEGCLGQCDEPGCIMNKEVVTCKVTDDAEPIPNTPEKLAIWTFDKYVTANGHDDGEITDSKSATPDELLEIITGFSLELVDCDDATAKVVTGADSKLGAFGTDAVSSSKSETACRFELNVPEMDAYNYQRITFKVMGADREISYQIVGAKTSGSVEGAGSEWRNVSIDLTEGMPSNKMIIYMTADGYTPAKMMRLDDIVVWGNENPNTKASVDPVELDPEEPLEPLDPEEPVDPEEPLEPVDPEETEEPEDINSGIEPADPVAPEEDPIVPAT